MLQNANKSASLLETWGYLSAKTHLIDFQDIKVAFNLVFRHKYKNIPHFPYNDPSGYRHSQRAAYNIRVAALKSRSKLHIAFQGSICELSATIIQPI